MEIFSGKKKWVVAIAAGAGAAALLLKPRRRRDPAQDAPPAHQVVDPAKVADYVEMSATTFRVRTPRDVLPGGLSAAMAPVFVVWDRSSFAPGGSVTIRNLNHGGNPIAGITVLRTAVLHPDRVRNVEYVRVPLAGRTALTHGQLRFVFEPGGIELVGEDGSSAGEPDAPDDLILSWEAWRPPGVTYSVLKGMDPTVYQLSLRAYSGVQRFIEDALQSRNWESFPLAMPGGRDGAIELLRVALSLGDGAGRHVISEILEEAGDAWVSRGPTGEHHGDAAQAWERVRDRAENAPAPGDQRLDLAGRTGYHSAIRSCASMALYQIDVAAARLVEQGHAYGGRRFLDMADIDEVPDWMQELSRTNVAGLFLRGPRMIAFARRYPTVIPGKIPQHLDDAGLLVHQDGKPVKRAYEIGGETPWGPTRGLLIR